MLEKLFTSKNRIKLLGFFLIDNESGRLREISKITKISVSVLSLELKNLFDLGIIKKENNIYKLNKRCIILSELTNIFIKTDFVVFPIKNILDDRKIEYAFIFGSFAKGNFNLESDIDLMIIGNIGLNEVIKKLSFVEEKIRRNVNVIVWTKENLMKEKKKSFIKSIFSKKIIILKGEENELRKVIN